MRKGDTITWTDVNGKEQSGIAKKILRATYLVSLENGKYVQVTKIYNK